ncbi:MAG: hypothetical protein WDO24_21910 [Pseudomonadota bacterium]
MRAIAETMPGDGAVRKASATRLCCPSSAARKIAALGFDRARVGIADRPDRLWQTADVVDRLPGRHGLAELLQEHRVALEIGPLATLPRAPQPGHAIAEIQHERIALLLAIIRDVDTRGELARHDRRQGRPTRGGERHRIDRPRPRDRRA